MHSAFPLHHVVSLRHFWGLLSIASQALKSSATSGLSVFHQVEKHQHFVLLSPGNIWVHLGCIHFIERDPSYTEEESFWTKNRRDVLGICGHVIIGYSPLQR